MANVGPIQLAQSHAMAQNNEPDYSIYAHSSPPRRASSYIPTLRTDSTMMSFCSAPSSINYCPPWRDVRPARQNPDWNMIHRGGALFPDEFVFPDQLSSATNDEERRSHSPEEEDYVMLNKEGNYTSSRDGNSSDFEDYCMIELVDGDADEKLAGVDEKAGCAIASNPAFDSDDDDMLPGLEGAGVSEEKHRETLERAAERYGIQWGDGGRDTVEKVVRAIVSNQPAPHWVHSDSSLNDLD